VPTTTTPAIALGHDPRKLRAVFERYGRLHIPNFLRVSDAEAISAALAGPVPWLRSVNVRGKSYDMGAEAFAAMTPKRAQELETAIAEGGRSGFQYQFDAWRISDAMEAGQPPKGRLAPLAEVYRLLNGDEFLGFVRGLTGSAQVDYADAQATRYLAGDFLTAHNDAVDGKNRLFAYVLNFTRGWRPDWGGLLLFHDADGHVAEGYTPTFNSLNIFSVPQAHAVSQVASFVTAPRLSITGWVRRR
jgi:SM-20-related protein